MDEETVKPGEPHPPCVEEEIERQITAFERDLAAAYEKTTERRHRELVTALQDIASHLLLLVPEPGYEIFLPDPKPSQPPGATIPSQEGVGTGEGEKVAEKGCEEARGEDEEGEEKFDEIKLPWYWEKLESWEEAKENEVRALHRLAERWLPVPGSEWVWQPDQPRYWRDVRIEEVRWNGEEFWITTIGSKGGVETTADNDLDRFLEAAKPCAAPAPPPAAEPAAETSSGGERCTAGPVTFCCKTLEVACGCGGLSLDLRDRTVHLPLHAGTYGATRISDDLRFCPWCGEKLGGEG